MVNYLSTYIRFLRERSGSTLILVAACAPVMFGLTAAAVDYGRLVTATVHLQQAVDEGALMGARELIVANMTDSQVSGSVKAAVYAQVSALDPDVQVTADVRNDRQVRVNASISYPILFGSILGLWNQNLNRTAVASLQGQTQLCVLTLDSSSAGSLSLSGSSRLTAPQCSAVANSNSPTGLQASGSAFLQSSRTCVVGGYNGNSANYAPMPLTGCPTHADPLSGVVPPAANLSGCTTGLSVNASTTLTPGTYCGGLSINGSSNVTLSPGVYIINGGDFHVTGSAQIHGQNVVIYFNGATGTFKADAQTTIDLTAPVTGSLAGFLIYQDPTANAGQDFHISSVQAHNLLGTIYAPKGKLTIDSSSQVAEQSAYTVIVAQQLIINGSANLTLNAMYSSTDVPVPKGVGPSGGIVALTQ